jgi:hypothetical protein
VNLDLDNKDMKIRMAKENETPQGRPAQPYEPPQLTVLGSLSEMTLGHPGPKSDGISAGSIINR